MATMREVLDRRSVKSPDGCVLWTGGKTGAGYGAFTFNSKDHLAHRESYRLSKGEIPDGMFVCHKCDVRNCINPDHLWLGSNRQNMLDKRLKGRSARGSKNGNSRLNEAQVMAIRNDSRNNRLIAKEIGVSYETVVRVKSRKSWSWL